MLLVFLLFLTLNDKVLLKARYTPVHGSDVEYGQGAIERNDLLHREIEPRVWLILVDPPGDTGEWRRRLNDSVDPKHGAFTVERATAEEEKDVKSGKITLQR